MYTTCGVALAKPGPVVDERFSDQPLGHEVAAATPGVIAPRGAGAEPHPRTQETAGGWAAVWPKRAQDCDKESARIRKTIASLLLDPWMHGRAERGMAGLRGAADLALVGRQGGSFRFLGIATEDCQGEYERMRALGVTFCGEPEVQPYGTGVLLEDLYGNTLT
jgi:Glyoxalase/Bleomycin resistance protein/Dioxygenase superfamily